MQYITTTELRTQTSELVKTLKNNGKVSLIHRSEIVGIIQPATPTTKPITDIKAFASFLKSIKPKKLIPREDRDNVYRAHLEQKYGKPLL